MYTIDETVTPDALELGVAVEPALPASSTYGGHFVVTVTARNPGPHIVKLSSPSTFDGSGVTFAFRLTGDRTLAGEARAWDSGDIVFTAGETKRHVFDFAIGDPAMPSPPSGPDRVIAPGSYRVEFGYGRRWSTMATTLVVSP